jgi:hypothetical protein
MRNSGDFSSLPEVRKTDSWGRKRYGHAIVLPFAKLFAGVQKT